MDNAKFLANQIVILDQPTQEASDAARERLNRNWAAICNETDYFTT